MEKYVCIVASVGGLTEIKKKVRKNMVKIIGGGRGVGNTYKELLHALEEADKLKSENECLLAQKEDLESENARLRAEKREMALRDLQMANEYGKLIKRFQQQQKVEKFNIVVDGDFLSWQTKNYVSEDLVEKAREAIKAAAFTHLFEIGEYVGEMTEARRIVNLDAVLEILDKMIEGEDSAKTDCSKTKCENCNNHNYCDYEQQESEEEK